MSNNKTRTSIYLSVEAKKQAELMAKAQNRTLSNFIETMIKEKVSQQMNEKA